MNQSTKPKLFLIVMLFFVFAVATTSCTNTEPEVTPTPMTNAEPQAPENVVMARDAVLEFLQINAIALIPPEGSLWHTNVDQVIAPDGFDVYQFTAESTTITVSYPQATPETLYNVSLTTTDVGFCWQAIVDDYGTVVKTGNAAVIDPGPGNPAALYCEENGYTYEIRTLEDGSLCGACIFSDNSSCRGWDYFYGTCAPGDNPEE